MNIIRKIAQEEAYRVVKEANLAVTQRPSCNTIGVVTDTTNFISGGKVTVILQDGTIKEVIVRGHKAIGVGVTVHITNGVIV